MQLCVTANKRDLRSTQIKVKVYVVLKTMSAASHQGFVGT